MEMLEYFRISLPEDIMKAEYAGEFELAEKLIKLKLDSDFPEVLKMRLKLEKERLTRLKREYIYDYEDVFNQLLSMVKGMTREELESIKNNGYMDWAFVGGQVKFHRSAVRNLIKVYPGLETRMEEKDKDKTRENENRLIDDNISSIMSNGKAGYYFRMRAGLKLKNITKPGEKVKIYLPVPRVGDQTTNVKLLSVSPDPIFIAREDHPQRTVYFEGKAIENESFTVEYSYEIHLKYNNPMAESVSTDQPDFYTDELKPHICFTPYLRELCSEIVGLETNPLVKARRIYDFITTKLKYSFVRNYFTIENIPEYAALNLKGDCGVQALLFITLCRIAGVPAKWQSGLVASNYYCGPHDWAQFYIAPYGWLFTDPSKGGSAYRNGNLKNWNFFFGNLDNFRMIPNSEFQVDFDPATKHIRWDPYDNQSGEAEYEGEHVPFEEAEAIHEVIECCKLY